MGERYERLRERLGEVTNLRKVNAVLAWDQATYMPDAGTKARGEQMATVGSLAHELFVANLTGELLEAAAEEVEGLPEDSDEVRLVRVARRDYDQARRVPAALVGEILRHEALSYPIWVQAKNEADFGAFVPCLEKTIEYSRQVAEYLGYPEQPYDALLDQYEPGMRTSQVVSMFDEVKPDLVALVHAIAGQAHVVDDSFVHQPFEERLQEEFGVRVARALGYDFSRGRLDRTEHPFETSFSINDVRITTHFLSDYLPSALFGTIHEAGHAMYEQGISQDLEGTPLADGTSLGMHESQSRMWENVVGRSRAFWRHFYPPLQQTFASQLGPVDLEAFYRAINRVEPSLIRVEADEVTYNLHVMLRLEIELALLSGDLAVGDAPTAWNDKMEAYLGLRPPTDREGILQDVHWANGLFGYFSTYSLGNFLSVQLFEAAVRAHPEILEDLGNGRFDALRGWLTENVYRHGRKFEPNELVQRATGEPIQSRSYIRYLREKFGEIYGLAA
jgi:carboxypeptidase Taq